MLNVLRFPVAVLICMIALALPYRLRVLWYRLVSECVHLPFKIFGGLSVYLMKKLEIENPYEK